jgi:hypothetical protein
MIEKLRYKETWTGSEDGYTFEIVKWGEKDNPTWNYYIYFTATNTTPEKWNELLEIVPDKYSINYSESWLAGLDWHYGITFGEFIYDHEKNIFCVKAGCDYNHYWDEGCSYDLQDVYVDCLVTIKSIPLPVPQIINQGETK